MKLNVYPALVVLSGRALAHNNVGLSSFVHGEGHSRVRGDANLVDSVSQPYLTDYSLKESEIGNKPFHRDRHLVVDEYSDACADPAGVLYEGTGHTVRCRCDESFAAVGADRVVCYLDEPDCSLGVCLDEADIWIFHNETGALIARSTCIICSDDPFDCVQWSDICFNAEFDQNDDMTDCMLLLSESDPPTACTNCAPCMMENGAWGMNFECFDGYWDTQGECTDASRVGLHPFDQEGRVQSPKKSQLSQYADQDDDDKSDSSNDNLALVVGIVGTANAVLLIIGIVTCACCMRQLKRKASLTNPTHPVDGVFKEEVTESEDHEFAFSTPPVTPERMTEPDSEK